MATDPQWMTPGTAVDRPRLVESIVARLVDGQVVVVTAPSGCSKSVLARQVAAQLRDGGHDLPVADDGDDAEVRRLRELGVGGLVTGRRLTRTFGSAGRSRFPRSSEVPPRKGGDATSNSCRRRAVTSPTATRAAGGEERNPSRCPAGRLHHGRCHSFPGNGGIRQASAAAVTVAWK